MQFQTKKSSILYVNPPLQLNYNTRRSHSRDTMSTFYKVVFRLHESKQGGCTVIRHDFAFQGKVPSCLFIYTRKTRETCVNLSGIKNDVSRETHH